MQTTLFTKIGNRLIYTEWITYSIFEYIDNWIKENKI